MEQPNRYCWRRLGKLEGPQRFKGILDTRPWALYKYGHCLATITFTGVVPTSDRIKGHPAFTGLELRIVPHLGYKAKTYQIKSQDYPFYKHHAITLINEIIDNRKGDKEEAFKNLGWDKMLHGKLPTIII